MLPFLNFGLGLVLLSSRVQALCSGSAPSQQAINGLYDCLTDHNVTYLNSSSPNWGAYNTPHNLRLQFTPTVITVPKNENEVALSVFCAAGAGIKVQPKGGGHSYASYSSGGQDGSMVIEMENFNDITMDTNKWIVKVGAGQRLGNIAQAIYASGKRAMPHGTCGGVGIAGHALHGGYGLDSRKWGLALDHIVGLDVILADGTFVYTDAKTAPDIFWAMKGAGDSFGIVTHFYMQTEPAPQGIISFSANLQNSFHSANAAATGFLALQNWTLTSPKLTPNITFGTYADSDGTFSISGWCMDCNLAVFHDTVFPEMLAGWPSAVPTVQSQAWIPALQTLSGNDALTQPLGHNYHIQDTFYAKSVVTKESQPLTKASLTRYFKYLLKHQNTNPGSWFSIINLYGGPGSFINSIPSNASAYSDRSSLWVFQNYGFTGSQPWVDILTDVIDGMNDAITGSTVGSQAGGNFSAYMNYVDPDLSAQDAHLEYYGESTYGRLVELKGVYDPGCLFWNPQAIGTS